MKRKENDLKITILSKEDDILECSFHRWGNRFRKLLEIVPFVIIPLEKQFVKYLLEDKVKFPKSVDPLYGDSSVPSFPKLEEIVQNFLKEHEHSGVFVKLNWSAPKDCRWVFPGNNLNCKSLKDIWIVLKSSDFIVHDIERLKDCEVFLVLKKWIEIDYSMEFRCFVNEEEFVGVCQRDISKYYPFLKSMKKEIWISLEKFWKENILEKFPLKSYTFDIFLDIHNKKDKKFVLLDFNVFGEPTHPLLFYNWHYFSNDVDNGLKNKEEYEIKIIEASSHQRMQSVPITGFPFDVTQSDNVKEMLKEYEEFEKKMGNDKS